MKPCPVCQKLAIEAFKPFCSKRCADVDLYGWLAEKYRLPVKDEESDADPARIPDADETPENPGKKGG